MSELAPEGTSIPDDLDEEVVLYMAALAGISALAANQWASLWRLLDPRNIVGTASAWIDALELVSRTLRRDAASEARTLTREWTRDAPSTDIVSELEHSRVVSSLGATVFARLDPAAPYRLRHLRGETGRRKSPRQLEVEAFAAGRAAMQRWTQGGARSYVERANEETVAVRRWMRVPRGDRTCAFCMMLASRGPIYVTREAALYRGPEGSGLRYHDGCDCAAVPVVLGRDVQVPQIVRDARRLWDESTAGFSGKDARNAFRRAWEAQQRAQ